MLEGLIAALMKSKILVEFSILLKIKEADNLNPFEPILPYQRHQ